MTTQQPDARDDGDTPAGDGEEMVETQVLGDTVLVPKRVTQAEPGSPETGARRDADGRPIA